MKRASVALWLIAAWVSAAGVKAEQATSRYTNAELVSINTQTRLVVIKNTTGREQVLKLDDTVTGFEGLRAGDRVILTLREEPGMTRISSIAKGVGRAPSANPATTRAPAEATGPASPGLDAFAEQVATLAQQADRVDALWDDFKTTCSVTLRSSYADGRDWFSLWDNAAQVDVSSGACRDLFNQVVGRGEAVKGGMVRAEEAARAANLVPGELRATRRRHSMEWSGWGGPAPELLKQ
jgi:hypothetical protein